MVATRNALAALCAAMLVACDRAADTITGPAVSPDLIPTLTEFLPGIPVLDPFASPDDAGVTESARGGGHFHNVTELRTFAFTAHTRADGTKGQYQINNRETGGKEHGTVTCLEVDGNEAWVGAIIERSNVPGAEGFHRVWRVIDNGEGSNDSPDQISITLPVFDAQTCHMRPMLPLNNIEYGNIQVRDAP
jgi:hypothetical protein